VEYTNRTVHKGDEDIGGENIAAELDVRRHEHYCGVLDTRQSNHDLTES
jgi:hypothetical protein